MICLASRTQDILPFRAVEVLKEAMALQASGRDIVSLGIGEPDFTAPPQVVEALERAARAGLSGYSPPQGQPALRHAIADYYAREFGAPVDPDRVLVTSGASGALMLAALAVINPGDEILLPDPCYPANRNFILGAGGVARMIPTSSESRFQLSADDIVRHWGPNTRGVLIASPSNPTGTSIERSELAAIIAAVRERGGVVFMDEIYLGLSFDDKPQSALALDDNVIVINSFSKYFYMTGWRLGWLILPAGMMVAVERMASSLAICAPTLAQHAAVAAFGTEAMRIFEQRRDALRQRRDYLLPAFEEIGLHVPVKPDGAFYIYADISRHAQDSAEFSSRLLHQAGVAAIAGHDFGPTHGKTMMRFSYATGLDRLEEAVHRMTTLLA